MTVFRFRNDSPVIPRPLHNSATRRLTTLPIELINDQRDMSVAGHKNAKYPPLRGNNGERHTTSLKLCNIKLDHFSIDGCQHLRRDMLIFSVSFQTLTDTQSKKDTKLQRCSGPSDARACSPDSNAVDHNSRDTKDTSVSAGSRRKHTVPRKNWCSRQKLPTTCNVRYTQSRRENNVQQRRRKNTVNVKYSRVATFARCPTKDVLKFRVKIEIR